MDKEQRLRRISDARALVKDAESLVTDNVKWARMGGASWMEIGVALGLTKQAAWARYAGELGYDFPAGPESE